jgi:ketosteroid isomerase-like protein
MSTETAANFDLDALRRATEARDAAAQLDMFADDAEVMLVDKDNPPSTPRTIRGREAIRAMLDDICSRDMTHEVRRLVGGGDMAAMEVACRYSDGTRVLTTTMMDLRGDRIAREEIVQAWDE